MRFERPGPMQLWGIDIVGGIQLVDVRTGVISEATLVTGIDDHSRAARLTESVSEPAPSQ